METRPWTILPRNHRQNQEQKTNDKYEKVRCGGRSVLSQILENYLEIIQEEWKDKFLSFLADIGILIGPTDKCKEIIKNNRFIYLYHGTRPEYVDSIKKQGLTLNNFKKRTKDEGDILLGGPPRLFFGNVYTGKQAGFGSMFGSQHGKVKYLLAKLNTKYLKLELGGYTYTKGVPPKDLIWDDDPRFHKIGKQSPCLVQYGKGKV